MLEQGRPVAVFAVANAVREESREAVRRLHEQGIHVEDGVGAPHPLHDPGASLFEWIECRYNRAGGTRRWAT